ncbi:TonB-dependent receptor [Bacteroidia bacterium]|nr:TonB-dependent receptor [Bacteroidia bacterium]
MKTFYYKQGLIFAFACLNVGLKAQEQVPATPPDSLKKLPAVIVTGPKYGRFSDYSAQTLQMSTFDIVTNPAAMADIIGNMRVLPGVQSNDNDGRLIIQGGGTGESQIYINDLIVANPYTLTSKNNGVRTRFNSDLFEGIVLQSGGFNAEFGQALSGIVNLNTKEREMMQAKTDMAVSSVYAGVTHIDKKPSYAYSTSLDYSNLTPYSKLFPDQYHWQKHYKQLSFDFFLTKAFSSRTKMTAQIHASTAGGDYLYETVDSVSMENDLKQNYLYAQLNLYHTFNNRFSLSVAGNIVIDQFSGTGVEYQNDKINTRNSWNHNKINLQYRAGRLTNRTGMELILNPYHETYTFGKEYTTSVNNNLASIYNDTKLFLSNNLTASIGIRGEYSNYLNRFNLAPRLYLGYRLNRHNIISASAGEYFQLPAMEYLKRANTMDFTSVNKATVSYGYVKKSSKFQWDAYYKKYANAITYKQVDRQVIDIENTGKGQGWGTDVFLKNNFKNLEYWFSYSFNHTKKQYDWFPEAVTPDYVSRHSLNATLKYWIAPMKSLVSANYTIASGTPYYKNSYPYNELGTTPLRNRLDISWSYLPRPWVIIHFGCQNVLGYKNIYGYEYSEIHPEVRQEIRNPQTRFLFLGVFITFSHNKKLNQLKNL